jgi:hypothetical protein
VRPNRSVVIPSGKYRASPVMTPGEYDALPTLPSTCKVPLMSTMVPTGKSFAAPPFLAQMGKVTRRQRQPPPLFSISAGRHTAGFLFQSFLRSCSALTVTTEPRRAHMAMRVGSSCC